MLLIKINNNLFWVYSGKVHVFLKKATKIDEIFTVDLTLCSKCQIDGKVFVNFCGLLKKRELYLVILKFLTKNNIITPLDAIVA